MRFGSLGPTPLNRASLATTSWAACSGVVTGRTSGLDGLDALDALGDAPDGLLVGDAGATPDPQAAATRTRSATRIAAVGVRVMGQRRSSHGPGSEADRRKVPEERPSATARPDEARRLIGRADGRAVVPVVAGRGEDVDDDGAAGSGDERVRRVADDPPRPARPEDALLVADPERDLALDDEATLLVRVAVLGHDGVGRQLHDREGQPIALDAAGDDAVPHLDREHIGEIDEVRHRFLRDGRASGVDTGAARVDPAYRSSPMRMLYGIVTWIGILRAPGAPTGPSWTTPWYVPEGLPDVVQAIVNVSEPPAAMEPARPDTVT